MKRLRAPNMVAMTDGGRDPFSKGSGCLRPSVLMQTGGRGEVWADKIVLSEIESDSTSLHTLVVTL